MLVIYLTYVCTSNHQYQVRASFTYNYSHASLKKCIMSMTYVVAVAVKWPEPEFTCQLNGSTTVQREPTWIREASEGLCGAEFYGLVAGVSTMLLQHQSATYSHQIQWRTCSLTKKLTLNISMFLPKALLNYHNVQH